jgi:hypothetical protein
MRSLTSDEPRGGSFARGGIVTLAVALLFSVLGFVGSAPANATGSSSEPECGSWKWDRTVVPTYVASKYKKTMPATPGVKEYKFKKSVKDYKTEYQYQKETRTKVKHGSGSWEPYGNWTWWSPPSYKWSFSNVEVLEGPAAHGSGSYSHNGHTDQWYREYRYVKNGVTRPVENGSHWEYYLTGGGSSLTNTDDNWTTDTPGSPWVKIPGVERWKPGSEPQPAYDLYYVQGEQPSRNSADASWVRQGQGPGSPWQVFEGPQTFNDAPVYQTYGYSLNEPPRGEYPNVPWNKIPGTQVECPNPVDPTVGQSTCVNNAPTAPTLTLATTPGITYTVSAQGPYSPGQSVVVTATWGENANQPANLPAGWTKTSATTATFPVTFSSPNCTPPPPPPPSCPPGTGYDTNGNGVIDYPQECDDVPPPSYDCPPGKTWVDKDKDGIKEPGECVKPGKASASMRTSCKGQVALSLRNKTLGPVTFMMTVRAPDGAVSAERFVLKAGKSRPNIVRSVPNGSRVTLKFKGHKPLKVTVPKRCGKQDTGMRVVSSDKRASQSDLSARQVVRRDF